MKFKWEVLHPDDQLDVGCPVLESRCYAGGEVHCLRSALFDWGIDMYTYLRMHVQEHLQVHKEKFNVGC